MGRDTAGSRPTSATRRRTGDESAELMRRIAELERIHEVGRKTKATVVTCEDTGRTFANVPVFLITFEIEGRQLVFEHVYGPRLIKQYEAGREGRRLDRPGEPGRDRPELRCGRRDSNPHALRHRLLRPACLPIPPRPRAEAS